MVTAMLSCRNSCQSDDLIGCHKKGKHSIFGLDKRLYIRRKYLQIRMCIVRMLRVELYWIKCISQYSKTCVKQPISKRPKIGLQDQLSLNAGQKYCRMLHGEHSAILSTFIKLPIVIKIFVLSVFEWPFYTDFNV